MWTHSRQTVPRPPTSLATGKRIQIILNQRYSKFCIMWNFSCLLRLQLLMLQQKLKYCQGHYSNQIFEDNWWDTRNEWPFWSLIFAQSTFTLHRRMASFQILEVQMKKYKCTSYFRWENKNGQRTLISSVVLFFLIGYSFKTRSPEAQIDRTKQHKPSHHCRYH